MNIAVIIVNFNGGDLLLQAIRALTASGVAGKNILVLDNASDDGSSRAAAQSIPGLVVRMLPAATSFAAANNEGLRLLAESPPDAVLFLNNDAVLEDGCLERLSRALVADPGIGAAAPLITYPDGRVWYAGGDIDWREAGGRLFRQGKDIPAGGFAPADVAFAPWCALLAAWPAIREVGLMDESYFFYDEDLDWCLRLRRAGRRLRFEPSARAVHHAGRATGFRGQGFIYGNMARNRLLTMRKHGTVGQWAVFLPWFGAMMAKKSFQFIISGRPGVAGRIMSGMYRGFKDRLIPPPSLEER